MDLLKEGCERRRREIFSGYRVPKIIKIGYFWL